MGEADGSSFRGASRRAGARDLHASRRVQLSLELHLSDWPHPLSRAGSLVASQTVSRVFVDCGRMWIITGPFDEDHNEQRAPESESYPPSHD